MTSKNTSLTHPRETALRQQSIRFSFCLSSTIDFCHSVSLLGEVQLNGFEQGSRVAFHTSLASESLSLSRFSIYILRSPLCRSPVSLCNAINPKRSLEVLRSLRYLQSSASVRIAIAVIQVIRKERSHRM
jgi:hypothetical protein